MRERRLRLIPFDGQALIRVMLKGFDEHLVCVENGLPEDTVFVETRPAYDRHPGVYLVVEHPSFDVVPEGDVIPIHAAPCFTKGRCHA